MHDIRIMKPNRYTENLLISQMCDISILPSGGGGFVRKKIDGEHLDQGKFKIIDPYYEIDKRSYIRKEIGINMTLDQDKLPKPVVVTNLSILQQQPLKNIADPSYLTINDLSIEDQDDLLGNKRLDKTIEKVNPLNKIIKDIQRQTAIPLPSRDKNLTHNELRKLLKK